MANGVKARLAYLYDFMQTNLEATTITPEEARLMAQFAECFDVFMADFSALQAGIPPWAPAQARRAARKADPIFREELAAHKAQGCGRIEPEA